MRCERLDHRSNRGILLDLERRLDTLERILIIMAEDFSNLSAAIDTVTTEIAEAVAILQNPAVDNNNQATIDQLTAKLTGASGALGGALPASASSGTTTGSAGPAAGDPNTSPAPADGSTTGDQTAA